MEESLGRNNRLIAVRAVLSDLLKIYLEQHTSYVYWLKTKIPPTERAIDKVHKQSMGKASDSDTPP